MTDNLVLTMKWGTRYSSEYANILYRAVSANTSGAVRFTCITDDPKGLLPEIETFPIQDLPAFKYANRGNAWPKVDLYRSELFDLRGRALFLDLDLLIVGSLDEFFAQDGEFIGVGAGEAWRKKGGKPGFNSSVVGFDIGGQAQISEEFERDPEAAFRDFEIEQQFEAHNARGLGFWPADWIVSYKYHLRRPPLVDMVLEATPPPPSARIVAFHGKPRPVDLADGSASAWSTFPYRSSGPVSWVKDYWQRYGNG